MDDLEAMIAAFEKWASNDGEYHKAIERNKTGQYILMHTHCAWVAWERAWSECQTATAHNTDAVIDKCIEAVEGCELVEGTNFKRIRLHQAIGSLLGLKRSLKTNKEG